jgi:hypothetical protein
MKAVVLSVSFFSCSESEQNSDAGSYKLRPTAAQVTQPKLTGEWHWGDDERDFSLTIKLNNDSINGYYCAIAQMGNRVDCSDSTDTVNCIVKGVLSGDSAVLTYTSMWDDGIDTAVITYLRSKDSLLWQTEKRNIMS